MKSTKIKIKNLLLLLAVFAIGLSSASQVMAQVSGAIFTSLIDGTTVNANHYDFKSEVYLNGGPQNTNSAGLTPGIYYFQITTPGWHPMSGETGLLSMDNAECRLLEVGSNGRIIGSYNDGGNCAHANGIYNSANGSTPVQMIPFADTTNPGGEYKAWIIKRDQATVVNGNPRVLYFSERNSKTDNFKVDEEDCVGETCNQPPPAVISGIKFHDCNMSATFDPSEGDTCETTISGWHIELYKVENGNETKVNETDTDANGAYSFEVNYVEGAVYKVKEVMQENWQNVTAAEHTVTLTANNGAPVLSYPNKDFGNIQLVSISGTKYKDADMSGTATTGDSGVSGVTISVNITYPNGQHPDTNPSTAITGSGGAWSMSGIPEGSTFQACETVPTGWVATAATCRTGTAGDSAIDFFNIPVFNIGGTKYKDADMSGTFTAGEVGVSGVTISVNITYPNGGHPNPNPSTTTTGNGGVWSMTGLPEGTTFTACETVPTGWTNTAPTCLSQGTVTGNISGLNFFNIPVFNIGGTKYYDSNVNGSFDNGEIGVSGVTINVNFTRPNGTTGTATATTVSGGAWSVNGLPEGTTFTACEVVPASWANTASTCLPLGTVSSNITGLNFFNVKLITPNGGKTLGFWSNNNGKSILQMDEMVGDNWRTYLNGLNLAKGATNGDIYVLNTAASFNDVYNGRAGVQTPGFNPWLLNANATNMAYMLSVQLAADTLDVREGSRLQSKGYVTTPLTGGTTVSLGTLATCINVIRGGSSSYITLSDLHAMGVQQLALGRYTVAASTLRTNQGCVKDALDKVNNNSLKVVAPATPTAP